MTEYDCSCQWVRDHVADAPEMRIWRPRPRGWTVGGPDGEPLPPRAGNPPTPTAYVGPLIDPHHRGEVA